MRNLRPIEPAREALIMRARLTADIARRSEDSAEPFAGNVDMVLCDLYRQSIYWSRCALEHANSGRTSPLAWDGIPVMLQRSAVADAEALEHARRAADESSFQDLAQLTEEERRALLPSLRSLALTLLNELDIEKRTLEALWTQRLVRVGLVFVVLAVVVFALTRVSTSAEVSRDIAMGKPWRASSQYGGTSSCRSPEQECEGSPEFFFHTNEEQHPWVEIDLGAAQSFSAVRVENRKDCCTDRANPLVVEVSSDQQHWRKVARRDSVFSSWLAKFDAVSARYVRVRLDRRESLHLQRVRVLR